MSLSHAGGDEHGNDFTTGVLTGKIARKHSDTSLTVDNIFMK
jgi:hypothetical protein